MLTTTLILIAITILGVALYQVALAILNSRGFNYINELRDVNRELLQISPIDTINPKFIITKSLWRIFTSRKLYKLTYAVPFKHSIIGGMLMIVSTLLSLPLTLVIIPLSFIVSVSFDVYFRAKYVS